MTAPHPINQLPTLEGPLIMFTAAFWKATAERAFKSVAQGALVALGASNTGAGNLFEANVGNVAGIAVTFGVVSLLTSISIGAISGDGPSLAPAAEAEVALAPLMKGN